MKLNNHGWGTKEFIFSIVAILILLLVVAINVHRLYAALGSTYSTNENINNSNNTNNSTNNNTNNSTNNNTNNNINGNNTNNSEPDVSEEVVYNEQYYKDYQNKMISATRNYIIYSNTSIPKEGLKIEVSTLINKNYINQLNDMIDGSACSGYSMVSVNSDSSLNIKTYLNCSNYVTEGY